MYGNQLTIAQTDLFHTKFIEKLFLVIKKLYKQMQVKEKNQIDTHSAVWCFFM